jgi:hypothetical protein
MDVFHAEGYDSDPGVAVEEIEIERGGQIDRDCAAGTVQVGTTVSG